MFPFPRLNIPFPRVYRNLSTVANGNLAFVSHLTDEAGVAMPHQFLSSVRFPSSAEKKTSTSVKN